MSGQKSSSNIVWVDLEMTGLNPDVEEIIETAVIVTDKELNILAEGGEFIINQPASKFEQMDDWNQSHHSSSGLWKRVLNSTTDIKQAEQGILDFIKPFILKGKCPLAGNSIWQDRRFIVKYMPNLDQFLHYRMIDTSSVKEIIKRWYTNDEEFKKSNSHRAMDDIKESIEELKFFRKHYFR